MGETNLPGIEASGLNKKFTFHRRGAYGGSEHGLGRD